MPGFIDGHAHAQQFGTQAVGANLLAPPDGTVDTIEFTFDGSDQSSFGLNTPAYFAMDNLTFAVVPEPSAIAAGVCGLVAGVILRWRRGRTAA